MYVTITYMAEPQINNPETENLPPSPGVVIQPGNATASVTPPAPLTPAQPPVVTPPVPEAVVPTPEPQTPEVPVTPEPSRLTTEGTVIPNDGQSITWTASEFHAHEKSASWYLALIIGTIGLAAVLYFLTRVF